ncbi:glutathione hydrolase 5 proenzyme-like isoform X2 [Protopterus annectens]|uniref:glutathione hydrolase 5 proenzyme-like isoform X2 n=1 Tax=Protopterus annectens TaxID=7888 RepID=UPI001CF98FE7|nr:glutathione hydrolase 5 proenzyme-like isoform X2 [Protopterus annectens]
MDTRTRRQKCWCCLGILVLLLVGVIVLVRLVTFGAVLDTYKHGAVAADATVCSQTGRDILKQGGSAVDAAIAALLCTSLRNPQSTGIGGGVIFTIYDAKRGNIEIINARETAPQNVIQNLTQNCSSEFAFKIGPQWIAVPGELRGYEEAHRRYGRLPWKDLFAPTIKMAEEGFPLPRVIAKYLNHPYFAIAAKKYLCPQFCKDGRPLKEGELIKYPELARTLKSIAENGAQEFYSGYLAEQMVKDLQKQGANLTLEDFRNYRAEVVTPLNITLKDYIMYFPPPPAGGVILSYILNILKGYNLTSQSVNNKDSRLLTYHRIIEAFKFANGQKPRIENPQYKTEDVAEILSDSFAETTRRRINDSCTYSKEYYSSVLSTSERMGTSHVSVIAADGSAVSVTSTINHLFGAMVFSRATGVIFNNELADFCRLNSNPDFKINPGEKPPSAMTPAILFSKDKRSTLAIGGAGGDMIITATAQAIMNKLWFGYSLKEAIALPRFYISQKFDEQIDAEEEELHNIWKEDNVEDNLKYLGHRFQKTLLPSAVQGVFKNKDGICAMSDRRKDAEASGY